MHALVKTAEIQEFSKHRDDSFRDGPADRFGNSFPGKRATAGVSRRGAAATGAIQ